MSGAKGAKGAKFWLRPIRRAKGVPDEVIDVPGDKTELLQSKYFKIINREVEFYHIEDPDHPGRPLRIRGSYFCTNPGIAELLIKSQAGTEIQFDAQEVADAGLLSPTQLASLGIIVAVDHQVEALEGKAETPLPDFAKMAPKDIRIWANDNGIALPSRLGRDDLVKKVREEATKKRKAGEL